MSRPDTNYDFGGAEDDLGLMMSEKSNNIEQEM